MEIKQILAALDTEIARLHHAKALLSGGTTAPSAKRGPGRPKSTSAPVVAPKPAKKKRNLSPEGRARIAAAVKARWAKQKKAAKQSV
jgi:hypothetical protein